MKEKQLLEQQLDRVNQQKIRENVEAESKMQVEAAKTEMMKASLEKAISNQNAAAEHTAKVHENEEKTWQRAVVELKENIFIAIIRFLIRIDTYRSYEVRGRIETAPIYPTKV